MDENKKPTATEEAAGEKSTDTDSAQPAKTYKKPSIRRHGNLRLMTQLE